MTASSFTRAILYVFLFIGAATLLGLTAYHVHFTLTSGFASFYVPVVVELLATSCLAIIFSSWFFVAIMCRLGGGHNSYAVEAVLLGIIWLMYLVGASVISRAWPNLFWCLGTRYVCRLLYAVVAFSWINWVFTTILLIGGLMDMTLKKQSPIEPAHGRPVPRAENPPMATIA